jgi:asparagine synthase (glutamine-hydrolysing)
MKQEFFVRNGEIISENEWIKKINSFKIDIKDELKDSESKIALEVRRLTDEAIKERVESLDNVGILFSGGLDSSYITAVCKKIKANLTCYTVGFQDGQFKNPEDVMHAQNVAKYLKLSDDEFKFKVFNLKEIEPLIRKTSLILKDASRHYGIKVDNVVTIGVGSVEVAANSISKKETVFFSGIGSEELFAGYERHKLNPTNDECFDGLLKMYQRDMLRDTAISKALKFNFSTPFLDDGLIGYSMKIPVKYKINSDGTKMILRKAAEPYLGKYSERPKKAAQYGSSFDRAIEKLAGLNKFKRKSEYLESLTGKEIRQS